MNYVQKDNRMRGAAVNRGDPRAKNSLGGVQDVTVLISYMISANYVTVTPSHPDKALMRSVLMLLATLSKPTTPFTFRTSLA